MLGELSGVEILMLLRLACSGEAMFSWCFAAALAASTSLVAIDGYFFRCGNGNRVSKEVK
jgi:hypothetical protein